MDLNSDIEIVEIPNLALACIKQVGKIGLANAYTRLINWANSKGILNENSKMATIYHDSYKNTEPHKVRMSACLILNNTIDVDGEIELTTIEKGKYIVGHYEIGINEFEIYWTNLFKWMNEKGYKKADKYPFEIYNNNFNEHPEKKAIVDFYIPIN